MLQYYEVYYFVAVIILKTPYNSLIIKILFRRSVYRCIILIIIPYASNVGTW